MGSLDDNDAIPYDDAFDENESAIIYRVIGEEMQSQRWNQCIEIFEQENVNAKIITYKNIGHEHPKKIREDILKTNIREK